MIAEKILGGQPCGGKQKGRQPRSDLCVWRLARDKPHLVTAFTQGLGGQHIERVIVVLSNVTSRKRCQLDKRNDGQSRQRGCNRRIPAVP